MASDDRTGQLVQGRYRLLRRVGEGSQGKVYLAEDLARAGEVVALKLVEELVGGRRDTSADHVLRWFRHPNWATVLDVGAWGDTGWFEVTRFVHGTSLASLEGPQSEELVAAFLEQGARVLGALHRRGLIHYDVTPGNWMLEWRDGEPHFVLTDGGLAHVGAIRGFGRGTPRYMAPEMTQEGEHDHRVDLYSLGLVAFRLACGREPIEGRAGEVLGRRRKERAPRLREIHPEAPAWAEELIASLLDREPNHRPHDGLALIRALGAARDNELPMFTSPEAAEVTRGGAMIANEAGRAVIDRLVATLDCAPGQEMEGPPENRVPVVIVRGPTDTGATRLSSHALDAARRAELPVVCLQGDAYRDAAIRPFRDMALGLRSHLHGQGSSADGAPESVDAAVEQIVSLIEAAPEPKSVLILVQSFEDFTEDAKTGLQALTRYLQARWMSQSSTTARIGLVLDVGEADSDDFTLPDRRTKTLETITPDLFDAEDVRAFVADRVPGLDLDDTDSAHLASFTEGLPGRLSNLLSQGCARGDVKHEADAWAWDLTHLADYRERHEASPAEMRLISQLGPDELRCAGLLALFPSGLPIDTPGLYPAGQLEPTGAFHHLTRQHEHAGRTYVRLRNDRVRVEILGQADAVRLREDLGELLRKEYQSGNAIREIHRAQAYLAVNEPRLALEHLLERGKPDADAADAARQIILAWARSSDFPNANCDLLQRVARTLGADRASNLIMGHLLDHAAEQGAADPEYATELLEGLDRLGRHQDAAQLARQSGARSPHLRDNAIWCSAAARAHLGARDARSAEGLLARALWLWRKSARARGGLRWIDLLAARAHRALLKSRHAYALRLLREATTHSAATGHQLTTARLLNNVGILEYEQGDFTRSADTLQASLHLRSQLGDIRGCVSTTYNLSRSLLAMGNVTEASARLQRGAALALRHGLLEPLAAILKQLGDIYDGQLNADLALESLERSLIAAMRAGSAYRTASAAWALAPLASAMGRTQLARDALRHSATLARARTLPQARHLHRTARCTSLLHTGQHLRARGALASIVRQPPPVLDVESHVSLLLCAAALGRSAGSLQHPSRPRREDRRQRNAYRTWCRYQGLARTESGERSAALASFQVPTPGLHEGTSAPLRRIAWEAIMARALSQASGRSTDPFGVIARYAKHAGERLLFARATCARALHPSGPLAERGRHFSDAVVTLSALPVDSTSRAPAIPKEFRLAYSALDVRSAGPRTVRHVEDLQALAHRLLSMFGEVRHADERLTRALRQVLHASAELDATGDVKELFRSVTRLTIDVTGAERALVAVPQDDGGYETTVSVQESLRDRVESGTASEAVINRALALRQSLLLHDVYGDEELMQRPSITQLSLRSIICAPMLRGDDFFGVVYADHTSAAGSFDETDLEVLTLFADQVARTLQARRLLADLRASMDKLKAAQERLVRGERLRTLGELSSGVAHEFNNLLTGILARAQLISLESTNHQTRLEAGLIERAAQDAAEIIRRLQSFSQREVQRGFEPVQIEEATREAVEFLRPLWSPGGTYSGTAVRVVSDSTAQTLGNATELREVVTNLLKNALDASPGGEVVVSSYRQWPHVVIEVRDSGSGMTPEVQRRIFDPFYTTKGARGTGLGLPLVAQIVERHRGTIDVTSAPGVGTRIRVQLPDLVMSTSTVDEEFSHEAEQSRVALRILVVDDDDDVREPLRKYLEHAGHTVTTAQDGVQALSVLQSGERPHVIITDVCMPRMDGVSLCREALAVDPSMRVVLMTGRTTRVEDADLRTSGARAAITKPFAMQALDAILAEAALELAQLP